jgi:hypothetical protein
MCDEAVIASFEVIQHLLQWPRGLDGPNLNNLSSGQNMLTIYDSVCMGEDVLLKMFILMTTSPSDGEPRLWILSHDRITNATGVDKVPLLNVG